MNNKAVSEIVGYIFVFGIILSAVTYAYINVNNLVKDTTDKYRVEGLRESFKRIQNVFFLSTYGGAPVQSIQVEFQGGYLYLANNTTGRILLNNTPVVSGRIGSLDYKYKGYHVSIENGAIWEDYYGYKSVIMEPRIFVQRVETQGASGAYRTVVMIVVSKLTGNISIAGAGSVNLVFNSTVKKVIYNTTPGYLKLQIKSPFAENWYDFFQTLSSDVKYDAGNSTAEMQVYYDVVIITVYETEVTVRSV